MNRYLGDFAVGVAYLGASVHVAEESKEMKGSRKLDTREVNLGRHHEHDDSSIRNGKQNIISLDRGGIML